MLLKAALIYTRFSCDPFPLFSNLDNPDELYPMDKSIDPNRYTNSWVQVLLQIAEFAIHPPSVGIEESHHSRQKKPVRKGTDGRSRQVFDVREMRFRTIFQRFA
ncbi:hypothetical protein Ddc_19040 [Ditylenchus destructor]|nr:hypothetical protein Ddc_19040 [Ditylenchus destructor]